MNSTVRIASSYWLLWLMLLMSIQLLAVAYVFQGMAPDSRVWIGPAAIGAMLAAQGFWLRGIRFTDDRLQVRGLLGQADYPLDAVVELGCWKLLSHARLRVLEQGQVRTYWFLPNRANLPLSWLGAWGQTLFAYPELEALLRERIPVNRQRAGLD